MKRNLFLLVAIISAVGMISMSGCKGEKDTRGTNNGHDWIDLGLPSGTKWATCNVGAENPEDSGVYFAWGETTWKRTYSDSTYTYYHNGDYRKITKYCSNSEYGKNGFTDNLTILEASDDAATANWGVGWRMPTDNEIKELFDNCSFDCTDDGVKLKGPNGKSIFMPAAGYRYDDNLALVGITGEYWSGSLNTYNPYEAHSFNIHAYGIDSGDSEFRSTGLLVRPVCVQ